MHTKLLISLLIVLLLASCRKGEKECTLDEEIISQNIPLSITRLENEFLLASDREDMMYLLDTYGEFSEHYLQEKLYPSRDALADELLIANQDTLMMELYQEVKSHYPDVSQLENELSNAFKYIKHYFPEYRIPKVYTFVSGFGSDIYMNESILVIGLDYFLPFEHRFQPPDLPQYISKRYQRDYIVPMVVTAISALYNETDLKQQTLLAEMIYYGKAYHFTKSILPCTPDTYIIGYTTDEVDACFANEELIWSHFVENDLLFETNPFEIRKYTGEAPATDEISPDAPGRIGRWLGWNIVDDYRFGGDWTLSDLMKESDTDKIFRLSGYRPRR